MALRKESEDLSKITTSVYESDWTWLKATYPKTGASKALRAMLRAFKTRKLREMAEAKALVPDQQIEVEID